MNISDIIAERKNQVDEMDKFLEDRAADGVLSEEDNAAYAEMENRINGLTDTIKKLEKRQELDKEMSMPTTQPITSAPMNDTIEEKTGVESKSYKDAMMNAFRSNFRKVSNVLEEGVDANGGYLVPTEMDSRLIEAMTEENIIRKLATVITTSGEHKINIAGTTPSAAWIDEGEALNFDTSATFSQKVLDAHKLHVAIKVTEELLYDNAFGLESYIENAFGRAIGAKEEDAFLNGTGEGQPEGIIGAAETGVTAASSTEVTADEIVNLVYSLKRPYRKNACFICNDATLAKIRTLKDTTGNYIWTAGLQAGEPDRLLGYPAYTSSQFPTMAAGNAAIIFGDISFYNIGDRGSRSFTALRELFAGNGMVGFVAKERVDGKLLLPEAVKKLIMPAG